MKKDYKAPQLSVININIESSILADSNNEYHWAEEKKNNTEFVDEGEIAAPETPKKFWDDEE